MFQAVPVQENFPRERWNYNSHHHIYDHLYDYNHLIKQLNDCIAFFKRDFFWTFCFLSIISLS